MQGDVEFVHLGLRLLEYIDDELLELVCRHVGSRVGAEDQVIVGHGAAFALSGDLDRVLEALRHLVGKGHDEVTVESRGNARKSVEAGAAASALLEA